MIIKILSGFFPVVVSQRQKILKKINEPVLTNVAFNLEDDGSKRYDFDDETMTFTQLQIKMFVKHADHCDSSIHNGSKSHAFALSYV